MHSHPVCLQFEYHCVFFIRRVLVELWLFSFASFTTLISIGNYQLLSHIFRTETVKCNEKYPRAAKRPEVVIHDQIILTDEVRCFIFLHFACLFFFASKSHRSIMGPRGLGSWGLMGRPRPYSFSLGVPLLFAFKSGLKH